MDNKKKKETLNKIAEFINYVKVQLKVKSANFNSKGKILYFNRKEVNKKWK